MTETRKKATIALVAGIVLCASAMAHAEDAPNGAPNPADAMTIAGAPNPTPVAPASAYPADFVGPIPPPAPVAAPAPAAPPAAPTPVNAAPPAAETPTTDAPVNECESSDDCPHGAKCVLANGKGSCELSCPPAPPAKKKAPAKKTKVAVAKAVSIRNIDGEMTDECKLLYLAGVELYNSKQFEAASAKFHEAILKCPQRDFQFNAGLAESNLFYIDCTAVNWKVEAEQHFNEWLTAGGMPTDKTLKEAQRRLLAYAKKCEKKEAVAAAPKKEEEKKEVEKTEKKGRELLVQCASGAPCPTFPAIPACPSLPEIPACPALPPITVNTPPVTVNLSCPGLATPPAPTQPTALILPPPAPAPTPVAAVAPPAPAVRTPAPCRTCAKPPCRTCDPAEQVRRMVAHAQALEEVWNEREAALNEAAAGLEADQK